MNGLIRASLGNPHAVTVMSLTMILLGAITLIHGESDAGNMGYADQIAQLWSDYNKDLSALTGQTTSFPMQSARLGLARGSGSGVRRSGLGLARGGGCGPLPLGRCLVGECQIQKLRQH